MDYIDTDIVIQKAEGRLLQDIIDDEGIDAFIKTEERIICGLKSKDCVIATGGSVIYSENAMKTLRQNGLILYLHVPYEEIEMRLQAYLHFYRKLTFLSKMPLLQQKTRRKLKSLSVR